MTKFQRMRYKVEVHVCGDGSGFPTDVFSHYFSELATAERCFQRMRTVLDGEIITDVRLWDMLWKSGTLVSFEQGREKLR